MIIVDWGTPMKRIAFAIMIVTVLSKVLGFARQVALSYFYGASTVTDAYLVSLTIPTVIFAVIGAGIGTGFIPMYSRIKYEQGPSAADRFTSNLISIVLAICTVIAVWGLVFTKPLVRLFASGFHGETLKMTVQFTRISIFAIYFTGLTGIITGYLRLHGSYLIPNVTGLPMNCIAILSVALSSVTNIYVLLIGTLVARAAELLFMVPFAKRKGFRFQTAFDLKDDNLHQMIHIAVPVIIGTSADQINVLVDRTLASEIAVGGISALNYASRLAGFVQGLFVLSISSVMYPMISKMASEHNMKGLKGSLSEAIGLINLMVVPTTIGAVIFAEPIVTFLFGRGAFTSEAVIMTSAALRFYSLGMLAFGLREVLSRAFYALQDTRTPMVNGAIAVVINIVLNLILSRYLGIGGLALATSFSGLVATLLLFVTLREKIGGFGMKTVFSSFCKISVASLVMGVIARSLYHYVGATTTNKALILAIGTGAVAYFILVYLLRVPEVERTLVAVRQRVLRRKTRETGAE